MKKTISQSVAAHRILSGNQIFIWIVSATMAMLAFTLSFNAAYAAGPEIEETAVSSGSIPELSGAIAVDKDTQPAITSAPPVIVTPAIDNGASITKASLGAKKFIGAKVKNVRGETLGQITDLMVNWAEAKINFAVLEHGGVAGIGTKHAALPVHLLKAATHGNALILDMSKDDLASLKDFDEENPPEFADESLRDHDVQTSGRPDESELEDVKEHSSEFSSVNY